LKYVCGSAFYEEIFRIDARLTLIWGKETAPDRNADLLQMTTMIVGTVADPASHLPALRNSGAASSSPFSLLHLKSINQPTNPFHRKAVRDLIWQFDSKQFQSWAIAFTKALHTALGDSVTAEMKEVWLAVIARIGDIIVGCYEKLRVGVQGIWLRKSNAGWKSHYITLTHDALVISSDADVHSSRTLALSIVHSWASDLAILCRTNGQKRSCH